MKNKLKQITLLAIAVLLLLPAISIAFPQTTYAAQENPAEQLERWLYYRGMRACLERGLNDNDSLSREDVINGKWSPDADKEGFGYLGPDMDGGSGNDGTVECDDGSIWVRGANLFGFGTRESDHPGPIKLLCAINRALGDDGRKITPNNEEDCEKSTEFRIEQNGRWQAALTKALSDEGSKDRPSFDINENTGPGGSYSYKALLYLIGRKSLETFCGDGVSLDKGISDLTNDKDHVSVDIVSTDGTVQKSQLYKLKGSRDQDSTVNDVYYKHNGNSNEADDMKCRDLAEMTRNYSGDYASWAAANKTIAEKNESESNGTTSGDTKPSCESEGGALAWLLCAVIEVIDNFISWLDRQVNDLLYLDSKIYSNDTVDKAWSNMRNIALLILVPMMMFMVIGTALNFGPFDPYTVKKSLPRMFIAVVFIVLSLPITQFGVALSNTVGQGLGNIILSASGNEVRYLSDIFTDSSGSTQGGLGLAALIGGAAGFAVAGIGALISFGAVAAVGLLIGFVILIMRQVLIVMMIVIAPLAILSWIFPGNDKLWGIWKGTFIALLLMYPIITMLLASGKFVAGILG